MQNMTKRLISILALAVTCALGLPDAMAQKSANDAQRVAAEPLQIKLVRAKVVLENGRESMQNAAVAQPGEVLEETATYTNTSKSTLKRVEATLPVPPNTELVMASIKPSNAKASVDGNLFSNAPLTRKVQKANGVEVVEPVPLSEYRYLRWYPGDLLPEQSKSFSARFKVANSPVVDNTVKK